MRADDAALCAADTAIPGLPVVLDADAVAPLLGRAPGEVVATYVRYKPGLACVVGYRTPDGPAYAYAVSARQVDKLRGWADGKPGARGATSVPTGTGAILLGRPESDPVVRGPARLAERGALTELLGDVLPGGPGHGAGRTGPRTGAADRSGGEGLRLVPLRYKPGRRWVARAELDGLPVAVVKAYRPSDARRAWDAARACGALAPRLLRRRGRHGLLAAAWVPGVPLADALTSGRAGPSSSDADATHVPRYGHLPAGPYVVGREVGEALARLHAEVDPTAVPGSGSREPGVAVHAGARALARLLPGETARAAGLAVAVGEVLAELDGDRGSVVALHGDLGPDQVVLGPDGPRLVDLDQVTAGHPAIDLGSFRAAARRLGAVTGPDGARAAADLARGVEDGYADLRGRVDERLLAACTAGALLRTAVDPFRTRRPDWADACRAVLDDAEDVLGPITGGGDR